MSDQNTQPSFTLRGQIFSAPKQQAGLYLVSTPIGNLGDITIRALETLAGCDVIACEDTRTSGVLLKRYGINRPKTSYTEHNADSRGADFIRQISEGKAIALISDAGTPLVSDPGFRLVRDVAAVDLPIFPIPGASAPLAALVGSGLDNSDFRFCGFLPTKAAARKKIVEGLSKETSTLMFFENPVRLEKTLDTMSECMGPDRCAVVARELTKMHETFHRGTLAHLAAEFAQKEKIRGEIVILIQGITATQSSAEDITRLLTEALETMKTKDAAAYVAAKTGHSKQELYKQALVLKNG